MAGIATGALASVAALMVASSALAAPVSPLASGAAVQVRPLHDVGTADLRRGDTIDLVVADDVVKDGYVVIPRGTRGEGVVTWRTGSGAFGKSGKMEFDLVDLEIDGRLVPVSGHYRIEGKGRTGEVVVAWVIGGLAFASQVHGDEAVARTESRYAAVTGVALAPQYAADPRRGAAGLDPYAAGRHAGMAARLAAESAD